MSVKLGVNIQAQTGKSHHHKHLSLFRIYYGIQYFLIFSVYSFDWISLKFSSYIFTNPNENIFNLFCRSPLQSTVKKVDIAEENMEAAREDIQTKVIMNVMKKIIKVDAMENMVEERKWQHMEEVRDMGMQAYTRVIINVIMITEQNVSYQQCEKKFQVFDVCCVRLVSYH